MAVSDYSTKDIQVATNAYVKPVNTGFAEAISTIGEAIQEVRTDRDINKFTGPLRTMKENVMGKGANAPQEALFIQGKVLESRLATGLLTEAQMSESDKQTLTAARQMILKRKLAAEQGMQKLTSLQISAEAWLRDNIQRRPDLAPQYRAIVRNELGMDVEGAAVREYMNELKKLEEADKPALSFSEFNDLLEPMEKYSNQYGNSKGAAEVSTKLLELRSQYGTDPNGAIAAARALSAGLTNDKKFENIADFAKAESEIATITKDLEDNISEPAPATEEGRAAQLQAADVFKNKLNVLREKLTGYDFPAGSDLDKKRVANVTAVNSLYNQFFDTETGKFSEKKYIQTRTMNEDAQALRANAQPLIKLYPLTQFLDEPTQKVINNAVTIGALLTNKGYIDNPAVRSQITGTKVNNALTALASSTGNTQSNIKNNPEAHLLSFIDITAPFTYEIYTDKERTNRIYVPASEVWSAGAGVLPRVARSLGPNGYVDKLYTESGDPKIVDITLSQLMTRATETIYRELGKTNLPNATYTKPDGTVMSSAEVLRTYFAPADYQFVVSDYYDKGAPKGRKLTTGGNAVLFRQSVALPALPKAEQNKIFDVWDALNAEAQRLYPEGITSFVTIFNKLNDRITGKGE